MAKEKTPVTTAVRALRQEGIPFTDHLYDYEEKGGTAVSARELGVGDIKTPRTWHIVSDVVKDFIRLNDLDDVMDQKYKEIGRAHV
jgi:hypothetical protein